MTNQPATTPGPFPIIEPDPGEIAAEVEDWWAAGEPDRAADRLKHGIVDSHVIEADPSVWVSVPRRGIDYHRATGERPAPTPCGRSTRTGNRLPRSEALALPAKPCRRCYPEGD